MYKNRKPTRKEPLQTTIHVPFPGLYVLTPAAGLLPNVSVARNSPASPCSPTS